MTHYDFPWDGPTKTVIEYKGTFYDVRSGWGEREGWTNNHVALPLADEEVEQYADNLIELDEDEVKESWGEETLEGMYEAVQDADSKGK